MKGKIFQCRTCGERLGENPSFAKIQHHSNSHHPERLHESEQEKRERQAELLKCVLQKITENERSKNPDENCASTENISNSSREIHRKIVASLLSSRKYTNPQELFTHFASRSEENDSATSSSCSTSSSTSSQPRTVLQCRKCGARLTSFFAVKEHYESHKREEEKIAAEEAATNTCANSGSEQNCSEMEITQQAESTRDQVDEEFVEQETPIFEHSSSEVAESTSTMEPEKGVEETEILGQECAIDKTDTDETMDASVPVTKIQDSGAIRLTASSLDKNRDPEMLVEHLEQECSVTAETTTYSQEVEKVNTNEAENSDLMPDNFIDTDPQAPHTPAVNSSYIQPQDSSTAVPVHTQSPNSNPANPVAIHNLNICHGNSAESVSQNFSPVPDIHTQNLNSADLANIQPLDLSPKKSARISPQKLASADSTDRQHANSSQAKAASIRPQNFTPVKPSFPLSEEIVVQDSTSSSHQASKSDVPVIVISDTESDDVDNSPEVLTEEPSAYAYTESDLLAESARRAAKLDKSAGKETGTETKSDNKSDSSKNMPCNTEASDEFPFKSQGSDQDTVDDAGNRQKHKDHAPVSATTSARTERKAFFDKFTAIGLSSAADSSDGGKENVTILPSPFGSPTTGQISESRLNEPELHFEPMSYSLPEMMTAENAKKDQNDADTLVPEIRIVSIVSHAVGSLAEHQDKPHEGSMDTETTDTAPESMIRTLGDLAVTPSQLPPASTDVVMKQSKKGRKNKKKSNDKQQKNAQTSKKGKRGRPKKPQQRRRLITSTSSEEESDSDKRSARKKATAIIPPKINPNNTGKTSQETPQKSPWDGLDWNSTKDSTCPKPKLLDPSTSEWTSTVDESVSDSSLDEANYLSNPQTVLGKSSSNPTIVQTYARSDFELTLQDKIRDVPHGVPKRPPKLTHRKVSKEGIDCSKKSENDHQMAEEVVENLKAPMSTLPVKKKMTARKSIRSSAKPVTFAAEQKKSLQECVRCGMLVSSDQRDLFAHWENDCNKGKL